MDETRRIWNIAAPMSLTAADHLLKMELSCCSDEASKVFALREYLEQSEEESVQLLHRLVQEGALRRRDIRLVRHLEGYGPAGRTATASSDGVCAPQPGADESTSAAMPLTMLPLEALELILEEIPGDEACCFALTCTDVVRAVRARFPLGTRTSIRAVVTSVARLRWAAATRCDWLARGWTPSVSERIARVGNLKVLQWAHAQGCPWDTTTTSAAAAGGHLDVLQWAHAQGCPWDASTSTSAASLGRQEVLEYLHAERCPWNATTANAAAAGGHLDGTLRQPLATHTAHQIPPPTLVDTQQYNNPNASLSFGINEKTYLLAVFEGDGANYDTHLNIAHFMAHRMKEEIGKHTVLINSQKQNLKKS